MRIRHVRPLDGCVNDVHLMRSVLADTFGFPAEHMTTITNGQATRDGILAAFDALVAATGHDDIVVIHYAGHGSQMTDREGDEASGFDSTIVPFDTARAPGENRDITDDEIHLKIEALAEKTAFTTLIFDACHSGTITRDGFGAKARSVEPDLRPASELPPSPIPAGRSRGSRTVGPSGWMPLADRYVLIAGCRDEERAYEYRPPECGGAVAHGALSYFLCQQLRQARPGTSYRDVFERVAALVNAENAIQHPQMEGRADRAVLGVEDLTPVRFVRITARHGERVTVGAGAAHGLTAGSTYRVFPPATKDPIGASAFGSIEILAVHALSADARVTEEVSQGAIEPGARAFESTHAFGSLTLAVECVAAPGFDEPRRALLERMGRSPLVRLADGEVPSVRIYLLAARAEVTSSTPVPQAGAFDTPRWAVVDATGNLMSPLKPLGDEATVVDNLGTIARYRQALSIENPDPGSILRGRVTLELLRRGRDGTWAVAEPDAAGGQVVFDEGELIGFRIASAHDVPVYVSLLDFGLTRAVTPIFPPGGAQEQLAPGRTFDLGTDGRVTFPLRWPAGFPFVDSPNHLREADAVETVKLFVTEQPADFFVLRQQGVRSATITPSRLRSLLQGAFHGAATRDIGMVTIGEEDWTTVSRTFVLRRRSSVALPPTGAPVSLGSATVVAPGLTGTAHVSLGKRQREVAGRMVTHALHRSWNRARRTLSTTMVAGRPRTARRRSSTRTTRAQGSEQSTSMATHSRVKSLTMFSRWNARPSARVSSMKSIDQRSPARLEATSPF